MTGKGNDEKKPQTQPQPPKIPEGQSEPLKKNRDPGGTERKGK